MASKYIAFSKEIIIFNANYPPSEFAYKFRNYYGSMVKAFEAAESNGKAQELQQELEDLFKTHNKASLSNTTFIPATFLLVTVKR